MADNIVQLDNYRKEKLIIDTLTGKIKSSTGSTDIDPLIKVRMSMQRLNALMAELRSLANKEYGD
jgi:hypothetical protein